MQTPKLVTDYCLQHDYGKIKRATSLGGGCINNATRLETENGPLFLKTNASSPPDMFEREAEGLEALAPTLPSPVPQTARDRGGKTPRVPKVLLVGREFMLQEFIEPGTRQRDFWETLGVQLAAMHTQTAPRYGFEHNNYIGSTPQINTWEEDGHTFFAEHRLRYQAELARRNHLLDTTTYSSVISLISRISQLVPSQPASIIHGDLWSGNIHTGSNGEPVLIDPAAYYGWAEAELAMMTLFGSPPDSFFRAYESARPLEAGYHNRFDLYNLYHLLNHLNLFGKSYLGSVMSIIREYH